MVRPFVLIGLVMLAPQRMAQCEERSAATVSIVGIGAFLAGKFDNAAQVAQDRMRPSVQSPPVPHVSITVEPTQRSGWELWRVHMDVDPEVAREAGADTSLDAVWAINISPNTDDKSYQLIPYSVRPSVNSAAVKASAFDEAQWFALEACALRGDFGPARIAAQVSGDEMCVAAAMGLGGKRAFFPSSIERKGDWLHYQLMYLGNPLRIDARARD
jgi:hypothetical protein